MENRIPKYILVAKSEDGKWETVGNYKYIRAMKNKLLNHNTEDALADDWVYRVKPKFIIYKVLDYDIYTNEYYYAHPEIKYNTNKNSWVCVLDKNCFAHTHMMKIKRLVPLFSNMIKTGLKEGMEMKRISLNPKEKRELLIKYFTKNIYGDNIIDLSDVDLSDFKLDFSDIKGSVILNNGQIASTIENDNQQGDFIHNKNQKSQFAILNSSQQSGNILNNNQKCKTIDNSNQKAVSIDNSKQQSTLELDNSNQVSESIYNNTQKAITIFNSKQQSECEICNSHQTSSSIDNSHQGGLKGGVDNE